MTRMNNHFSTLLFLVFVSSVITNLLFYIVSLFLGLFNTFTIFLICIDLYAVFLFLKNKNDTYIATCVGSIIGLIISLILNV
jgi:hypothetical protein